MEMTWDSELAKFLTDLSAVQDHTLSVLTRTREMIRTSDAEGLATVDEEERRLVDDLQHCLDRRQELLDRAHQQGLPSKNIRSLVGAIPGAKEGSLGDQVRQSQARSRALQIHNLTNWVLVQRTLLHLSQILEIIATGGRLKPTYGKDEPVSGHGTLMDRAV